MTPYFFQERSTSFSVFVP